MRLLIDIFFILFLFQAVDAKTLQGDGINGAVAFENFIKQGDAELVYKGVRSYRDGTSSTPTSCSGSGVDGVTVDRVKSQAMSGDYHWMVFKAASNSIGSGVAVDFDLSNSAAIPGTQIEIGGILKDFVSGAFGDGSPFKVFIYVRGKSQLLNSFDGSSVFKNGGSWARWFTPSNSKQYTLCFHVTSTLAEPLMIGLDDLYAKIKSSDTILYQAENTYTAFVNGTSSPSIVSDLTNRSNWIGNCSIASTGEYNCPVIGFNNKLNCFATMANSSGTIVYAKAVSTNTSLKIYTSIPSTGAVNTTFNILCEAVGSDRKTPNVVKPADSFSTDTANLVYASSAQYTLATLANAPVGTFITFTYAAGGNVRTQTTTAPTQTTADMRQNGIRVYTRAYNSASTAANPAIVAIQIGKGFKGKTLDLYKSAGKILPGSLDFHRNTTSSSQGALIKEYDESSGILVFDTGYIYSEVTDYSFRFSDGSTQVNGYLVINAAKTPVVVGDETKVYSIAFGGAGGTMASPSNCTSNPCTIYSMKGGNWISRVDRQSSGNYLPQITPGFFKDTVECTCSSVTVGSAKLNCVFEFASTTQFKVGGTQDGFTSVVCTGVPAR